MLAHHAKRRQLVVANAGRLVATEAAQSQRGVQHQAHPAQPGSFALRLQQFSHRFPWLTQHGQGLSAPMPRAR